MTGIIDQRLHFAVGAGLVVLMALGFSIQREEEMVMRLTIIIVIIMLGLVMPLFWIIGTMGSITNFFLKMMGPTRKERTDALSPQLGITMADGGDPIDKEKNESAAVKQVIETSQDSPEQITLRPVRDKMFWWGGYY
jgi:CBS domain containing-hemolysin-like protein